MLGTIRSVTNMSSISKIGDVNVLQFRAIITENGNANITKNIKNMEIYMENQEECDADYAAFETEVLNFAK